MTSAVPILDAASATRRIRERSFTARCGGDVGIELEWLTVSATEPSRRPTLDEIQAVVREAAPLLPRRGRLTVEPGGQLEISSRPNATAPRACEAAATDLYALEQVCRRHGLELLALGADPVRPPQRIVTEPRYRIMHEQFDRRGPEGRTMMCNTASVQLNVGLGRTPDEAAERWRVAHQVGPALAAAFANSPIQHGADTGRVSSRLAGWFAIDPSRTAPVDGAGGGWSDDPAGRWADFALDAEVLFVRHSPDRCEAAPPGFTFRRWIQDGHPAGYPAWADLDEHLTTLFPPVRPRGWLEIRYLDALPTPFWHVAVAVLVALLDDPTARRDAGDAAATTGHRWSDAAGRGLADDDLAGAATELFAIARDALGRDGADDAIQGLVARYHDEYVRRRRSPATDRREALTRRGELVPAAESPLRDAELEAIWS